MAHTTTPWSSPTLSSDEEVVTEKEPEPTKPIYLTQKTKEKIERNKQQTLWKQLNSLKLLDGLFVQNESKSKIS